jgi:hypothetical protein
MNTPNAHQEPPIELDLNDIPLEGLADHLRTEGARFQTLNVKANSEALDVDFRSNGMRIKFAVHFTPQPDPATSTGQEKRFCLNARIPLRCEDWVDVYEAASYFERFLNGYSRGPRFVFRQLQSKPPDWELLGEEFDTLVAYWDLPQNGPIYLPTVKAMLCCFVASIHAACSEMCFTGLLSKRGGSKAGQQAI